MILDKEFCVSCVALEVLTTFCLLRASRCVYPHVTDLLSESGAALRINTDTLSAHTPRTQKHAHAPSTLAVSSVS